MEQIRIDRREFTLKSAVALLSGVAITISGCGEADGPGDPSPSRDRIGNISNNHGHSAVVVGAQLDGQDLILDIRGAASHTHSVSLTRNELVAIGDGRQVVKTSSTGQFHQHTVTFN